MWLVGNYKKSIQGLISWGKIKTCLVNVYILLRNENEMNKTKKTYMDAGFILS